MRLHVVGQISAPELLKQHGVSRERMQAMLIDECVKEMDRYVPMDTGTTKNTRRIEKDGVAYLGPHVRYIYNGMLMVAPSGSSWAKKGERKHLTDQSLSYHGAPTRGPFWDIRMWADKGDAICRRLAQKTGGHAQ